MNGLENMKKKKGGTCIYYFFSNVPKYISADIMTVVVQEWLSHILQTEHTSWYTTNPPPGEGGCQTTKCLQDTHQLNWLKTQ